MTAALSDKTIAIVKATIPVLEAHGLEITQAMYRRLFENDDIRQLFNQSHQGPHGSQPKALAGAILAYASHIENPAVLASAIERIAQRHAGLNILPEHYPLRRHGPAGRDRRRAGRGGDGRRPAGLGRGLLVPGRRPDRP
jgi:nitric oxide dioxygenase